MSAQTNDKTKRVLLISNSTLHGSGYLDHAEAEIRSFLGSKDRVLFISYALYDRNAYAATAGERFQKMGHKLDSIHTAANPRQAVNETDAVFGPSGVPLDDLLKMVNESDFAVFIISPDDEVTSRKQEYNAPRDNTVFELGLFMGKLERSRTFIVKEDKSDVKIPTDLLGITPLTYVVRKGGNLTTALAPVCTELRKVIGGLGVR